MPHNDHPDFTKPENPDQQIWRYMDLPKFLSLLDRKALYYARIDRLGDPFEGSFTQASIDRDEAGYEVLPDELKQLPEFKDPKLFEARKVSYRRIRSTAKNLRTTLYASCWHAQEHESAAMWSQYIKSGDGIAVRSTYSNLIAALAADTDYAVYAGMVQYLDYKKDTQPIRPNNGVLRPVYPIPIDGVGCHPPMAACDDFNTKWRWEAA